MAPVTLITDFLLFLHKQKKLSIATIEGYRTAINKVVKVKTGVDIGTDANISALLKNFAQDKVTDKSMIPKWDLSIVLDGLNKTPFEPLETTDIRHLTFKTVFLITLSSGRRRSEIHALDRESVMWSEDGNSITINPDPKFIAKTELMKGNAVTRSVTFTKLEALSETVSEEDRKLCPVRALRIYLERTDPIRQERKNLILSIKEGHTKDIAKSTISSMLKRTIHAAYSAVGETTEQARAHEIRAVAASWAFYKNVAVEDILKACQWSSQNTFARSYLRNMTYVRGNLYRFGPTVGLQGN